MHDKKKRLVIVGNATNVTSGPIQPKQTIRFLNKFINQADIIIRMNNIKNIGVKGIGSRTNILAIMNTGKPKYLMNNKFPQLILKDLEEILFVVPPEEIDSITPSKNSNHGIQFADKILKHQGWCDMRASFTDYDQMLQLFEKLKFISGRDFMASTGLRVIEHVLSQQRFHDYKIYLVGFSFEGWSGHAFEAERAYVQELLDKKNLHVPIQTSTFKSMKSIIKKYLSFPKYSIERSIFNNSKLKSVDRNVFKNTSPSPRHSFNSLLSDEYFIQLTKTFPSLNLFEKHVGIPRAKGQRSHDRWYLALEKSKYGNKELGMKGVVAFEELSIYWKNFINEIKFSKSYNKIIKKLLGNVQYNVRFAWHVASVESDISPHVDSRKKAGTHIFYFNTKEDWKEAWGGHTLFLGGPKHKNLNPEISDFKTVVEIPIIENKSVLFKNTPNAWHGVAPIQCEAGYYRKLFNVIFEYS